MINSFVADVGPLTEPCLHFATEKIGGEEYSVTPRCDMM